MKRIESNVQYGGRNCLWRSTENFNERNIQRRIWEAIEKPTKSYKRKFWYHHERSKESSEWCKWTESKSQVYRGSAGRKVANTEKKVEKLQEQINELWDYQVDPERLEFRERKIVELEDRSRRNNLCIDGISEKENETWDECEQEVQSLIKGKLGIAENIVI